VDSGSPLRALRIVGLSFIPVVGGAWIAVIALNAGWDDPDTTLARGGAWLTAGLGLLGLIAAIRWRSRVTEQPVEPEGVLSPFFITLAFAEAPLLVGFVFTILGRDPLPFLAGTGFFTVSLALLLTGLDQIELTADGSTSGIVR
jgi:hypothetical protein